MEQRHAASERNEGSEVLLFAARILRMDGWMDGGREGWMDGWMYGRTDGHGWMDGWIRMDSEIDTYDKKTRQTEIDR